MGASIQQVLIFIIQFIFGLYSFLIILRLWIRLFDVSDQLFFLEGIAKATNPLLKRLRSSIPDIGRLESSSLVLLFVLTLIKLILVSFISGHIPHFMGLLAWTLMTAIESILDAIFYVMIILAILSWIPHVQPAMFSLLTRITTPLLAPIRKYIPLLGGMDVSPVVLLLIIQILEIIIVHPFIRVSLMAALK